MRPSRKNNDNSTAGILERHLSDMEAVNEELRDLTSKSLDDISEYAEQIRYRDQGNELSDHNV